MPIITTPNDLNWPSLLHKLTQSANAMDGSPHWPAEQWAACADHGVFRWFIPKEFGGFDWSETDLVQGYLQLSQACLTTTFILTQWAAACRRIVISSNQDLRESVLPRLAQGEDFTTVAISHLTTSRQHLKTPILQAQIVDQGFCLNGFSPWVTGASHAQTVVTGAVLPNGEQVLLAVPTDLPGVEIAQPAALVGLSGSCTGEIRFKNVQVPASQVVAGPLPDVIAASGTRTGGLQTSTLALGLAQACIQFVQQQAEQRSELNSVAGALLAELQTQKTALLALAAGNEVCSTAELRKDANSLVLRASQAALAAAKGTGYVIGHPAGRWCREALFFLVWSCPQPVVHANLCQLAGIVED